jgi:hypothetical protein
MAGLARRGTATRIMQSSSTDKLPTDKLFLLAVINTEAGHHFQPSEVWQGAFQIGTRRMLRGPRPVVRFILLQTNTAMPEEEWAARSLKPER